MIELLIVVAVIGVIAAIAVPNLLRSKISANEASAITTIRNLVSSEMTYMTTAGGGKYGDITDLAGVSLVDAVVAGGTKDGYTFAVSLGASSGTFSVISRPVNFDFTGTRSFYSDESGVIRYTTADAAAGSADDPL